MSSPNEIKKGVVINHNGQLHAVVDFQHVNPGKGSAFVRTKMKNLSNDKVIEITYKSSENIDLAQVNFQTMQFLYQAGDNFAFMNMDTYEQIEIEKDLVGDQAKYLKEGLKVVVGIHEDKPVSIQIPKKIQYRVKEAPPAVRGDSAAGNVTKDIILDNGLEIKAPIFIKENDEIMVNTETGDYCERVSN